MVVAGTTVIVPLTVAGLADEHGHGYKKHQDPDDDDDRGDHYHREHERGEMRVGITTAATTCPRGFAKRDQLPPGLEMQLRVRGTLPPGLRKKLFPCPEELEGRSPPPPRGCAHVVIGGHVVLVVLVNRSSYVVLDIFHFER